MYLTRETTILSHIIGPLAATYQKLTAQPRNFLAIGILITIVFFGLSSGHLPLSPTASADAQRLVSLYADGQKRVFATEAGTVREALDNSNVQLAKNDLVEPSLETEIPQGFFNINVYRARPVLVQDGYKSHYITSAYQSPRLLAEAAGLHIYPEDGYTTTMISEFVDNAAVGIKVEVKRAMPLTIHADGTVKSVRTQSKTVREALDQSGVSLGLKDTASVPMTDPVVAGMNVAITRVTDVETTISTQLPRGLQTVNDPNVLKGETHVRQEGSDGEKSVLYRIHYRDGVEVSREQLRTVSQTAPVDRVVMVGTKVLFAGSVEHWRPMVIAAATQWGLDPNMMMRIMSCESKGNATSVSHFVVNGQHPTGLFQYLPSTWRSSGGTDSNILDGATQIQITAKKMATQGTGAWQCK